MADVIPPLAPHGYADVVAHYGDPKIQMLPTGWTVDPAWESANCVTVQHGLLPRGKLYCHRLVATPLLRLLDRWSARIQAGDPFRVKTLGCFAPRAQRGSNGLVPSMHTFAIAFDLNANDNLLVTNVSPGINRKGLAKTIPDAWIADAEAEGWFWGGNFQTQWDPMHFQLATGV